MIILKVMYETQIERVCESGADDSAPYLLGGPHGARRLRSALTKLLPELYALLGGRRPTCRRATSAPSMNRRLCWMRTRRGLHLRYRKRRVEAAAPHAISMMFWSGPGSDADVIKVSSAYEAATTTGCRRLLRASAGHGQRPGESFQHKDEQQRRSGAMNLETWEIPCSGLPGSEQRGLPSSPFRSEEQRRLPGGRDLG